LNFSIILINIYKSINDKSRKFLKVKKIFLSRVERMGESPPGVLVAPGGAGQIFTKNLPFTGKFEF